MNIKPVTEYLNPSFPTDRWAIQMIEQEYKRCSIKNAAKYQIVPLQAKLDYEDSVIQAAIDNTISILTIDDEFCNRVNYGWMHPSNRISRRLFTALTGVDLPKTIEGTYEAIEQYAGSKLAEYAGRVEAEKAKKKRAEEQEQKEKEAAEFTRLRKAAMQNDQLSADELVDLARLLGVEVHPRTIGMMRKRVHWVTSDQLAYTGKRMQKTSPCKIYQACVESIDKLSSTNK